MSKFKLGDIVYHHPWGINEPSDGYGRYEITKQYEGKCYLIEGIDDLSIFVDLVNDEVLNKAVA